MASEEGNDREFDETKDCPVCYNIMVEPVTLPKCGHTFCIGCLNIAYAKQQSDDKKCPLCRQEHKYEARLDYDDVDEKKQG